MKTKRFLQLFTALAMLLLVTFVGCKSEPENILVTSVSVSPTTLAMVVGDTRDLTVSVFPENATNKYVTYSVTYSSGYGYSAVSISGHSYGDGYTVTAERVGTETLTFSSNDGSNKTATCVVTVTEAPIAVTGITLDPTKATLAAGSTLTLNATVKPENATNKTVTWSAGDSKVATVSSKGLVTAVAGGSTTITATTQDGNKRDTCTLTVTQPVTGITLSQTADTVAVGETLTLTADVLPENATNKTVTWKSSRTSVATVTNQGVVTALAGGTTTITAITQDGDKTASCTLTVTQSVTGVELNRTTAELNVGSTMNLTATVRPVTATNKTVDWTSSNPAVATVTDGAVTALSVGSAIITATTQDGNKTATCALSVLSNAGGGTKTGLYLGIIGFNQGLNEKIIGLLTNYDGENNKGNFQSFINSLTAEDGTGLYYAVDNAISRLEDATLPADLDNVSIVTFTDGLDNVSTMLNTDYSTRDAYRNAIKDRITNTKIKDLPINAYSIGVKGNDVTDEASFDANLADMASSADKAIKVTNMTEVNNKFAEIAASLYNENRSQNIALRIPGGIDDNTKIRFTFDDVTDAAASNLYIEGTFRKNGDMFTFEDVVYKGLTGNSDVKVTGVVEGVFVKFTFNVAGGNVTVPNSQQWEWKPASSMWERNEEFGKDGDVQIDIERKSAVIILVLDCTTSLGATGISEMKSAANNFINVLTSEQ